MSGMPTAWKNEDRDHDVRIMIPAKRFREIHRRFPETSEWSLQFFQKMEA